MLLESVRPEIWKPRVALRKCLMVLARLLRRQYGPTTQ